VDQFAKQTDRYEIGNKRRRAHPLEFMRSCMARVNPMLKAVRATMGNASTPIRTIWWKIWLTLNGCFFQAQSTASRVFGRLTGSNVSPENQWGSPCCSACLASSTVA
jgi:hypothetical protein